MTVSLSKGQGVSLAKADGGALSHVRLGLGWDARTVVKRGMFASKSVVADIDLDASAILLDASGRVLDTVWYAHLHSRDGSVNHTGDNLTGKGDGDDESILVDLARVPSDVKHIVFTVNSFSGDGFSDVENAYVRVLDTDAGDAELARVELSESGSHTAIIMARLSRENSGWSFTSIGEVTSGRDVNRIASSVSALLA